MIDLSSTISGALRSKQRGFILNPFVYSSGGGGTPTWFPDDLTTPASIWLNDDSGMNIISGACDQWNDLSGNSFHLSNGNATARPTVNSTGLNGKRTLTWDGVDDCLLSGSGAVRDIYRNTGAGWAFIVIRRTALDSSVVNRGIWFTSTNTQGAGRFFIRGNGVVAADRTSLNVRRTDGNSITTLGQSSALDTSWHMLMYNMNWATGGAEIYKDGTLDASNSSLTSAGVTGNTAAANPLYMGAVIGSGSPSQYCNMEMAEFITGSGSLPSPAEIDKLFGYAAHKWGLTALLPGGHPYKSSPP